MSARVLAPFGCVLALSACGGTDLGRPPAPDAVTPVPEATDWCEVANGYEFQTIVDFDQPGMMAGGFPQNVACDPGVLIDGTPCKLGWNADDTCTSAKPPVSTSLSVTGPEVPGGRCGAGTQAFNLQSKNLGTCIKADGKQGWGGNFEVTFQKQGDGGIVSAAIDASAWDGISFWARVGEHSLAGMTVVVADPYTSGMYIDPNTGNSGMCDAVSSTAKDSTKCDPFGAAISVPKDWTFYTLPFEVLKQKGYGVPSPLGALDPTQVRRLQVSVSTGDWDLWVDDIAFYRTLP